MKKVNLWGYTIYENGDIYNKFGNKIKESKQIKINFYGKESKYISYARFVYYAFNIENFDLYDKSILVKHKDKDKNNNSINNLMAIDFKKCNKGENSSSMKLTDEQIKEIRNLYLHKKDTRVNKNDPFTKISYRKLAKKFGVSHSMIAGIIKGVLRNEV